MLERFFQPQRIISRVRSEVMSRFFGSKTWCSTRFFQPLEEKELLQQRQAELWWDLSSYFDEYVAMQRKLVYDYGPYGINNAYDVRTSVQSRNHENQLKQQGKNPARARLETRNAHIVEHWMEEFAALEAGQSLIQISPRGSKAEGYPGESPHNYVFINCYHCTRTDPRSFQLIQYRSFAENDELERLQKWLSSSAQPSVRDAFPTQDTLRSRSHTIIARSYLMPSSFLLSLLETKIYQYHQKWAVDITDLPDINFNSYGVLRNQVLSLLMELYSGLVQNTDERNILAFDAVVIRAKNHLSKWIQNNSANYQSSLTEHDREYQFSIDALKRECLTAQKQALGYTLSREEYGVLQQGKKSTVLNYSLPFARLGSLAHCIVGTPTSLVSMSNLAHLSVGQHVSALSLSQALVTGELSRSAVSDELLKISSSTYVEITLGSQTWMVPEEWCVGKGCYLDPQTGAAMGPCAIPLNYPGSLAYRMNRAEFEEYKSLLQNALLKKELQQAVPVFSESDKQYRDLLLKRLQEQLFKHTISLTECIANEIPLSSRALDLIPDIYQRLNRAVNALAELEKIVLQLELHSGQNQDFSEDTHLFNSFFVDKKDEVSQLEMSAV